MHSSICSAHVCELCFLQYYNRSESVEVKIQLSILTSMCSSLPNSNLYVSCILMTRSFIYCWSRGSPFDAIVASSNFDLFCLKLYLPSKAAPSSRITLSNGLLSRLLLISRFSCLFSLTFVSHCVKTKSFAFNVLLSKLSKLEKLILPLENSVKASSTSDKSHETLLWTTFMVVPLFCCWTCFKYCKKSRYLSYSEQGSPRARIVLFGASLNLKYLWQDSRWVNGHNVALLLNLSLEKFVAGSSLSRDCWL